MKLIKLLSIIAITAITSYSYSMYANVVFTSNDKKGIKDDKGDIIVKAKYDEICSLDDISSIEEGYIVENGGLMGVLDRSGNIILPCKYNGIYPFTIYEYKNLCRVDSAKLFLTVKTKVFTE